MMFPGPVFFFALTPISLFLQQSFHLSPFALLHPPQLLFIPPPPVPCPQEKFRRNRELELKHGRICMVATIGMIVPDLFGRFGGCCCRVALDFKIFIYMVYHYSWLQWGDCV